MPPQQHTPPTTTGDDPDPAGRPDLPHVVLAAAPPVGAAVVALPTRAGEAADAVPVLLAEAPQGTSVAALSALLVSEDAKGRAGEVVSAAREGAGRLLLVGTGAGTPPDLRTAAAAVARRAKGSVSLSLDLRGLRPDAAGLRAVAEAVLLASYGFTTRPGAPQRVLHEVTLVVDDPAGLQPALDRALGAGRATALARDLVNTPPLVASPAWLAERAVALLPDLQVRVRDERALAGEGFGGLVAVGQGSARPPRLAEARYDGHAGPHVVLVGKGITFDSGGLSLKTTPQMATMKSDMSGAATVAGVLRAVADLRLPVRVTGLLACAENLPSGSASRPGDVLTQYGGRTVEVLNTDAEGRLVLADALAYAERELAPDVLVDVATLTGAMPVALGGRCAGLFSSDDALAGQLERAAEASGERLWRMPLVEDYRSALESPTADLRNIGDPERKLGGGSITAALFLREFTGGLPWAHLDIAGPAWSGGDDDELTKGGTGYGVRLLVRWLEALAP